MAILLFNMFPLFEVEANLHWHSYMLDVGVNLTSKTGKIYNINIPI